LDPEGHSGDPGKPISRVEKAKAAIAAAGGEMKAFYVTLGRHDMVAVIEMPDDAAYAKAMLALGSRGGVRTESLVASR